MRQALTLHPDSRCAAVARIEVEAVRTRPEALRLRYLVTGDIDALRIPPLAQLARADGLWRRTCFEAFLRAGAGEAYHELNFAPSQAWAAYSFESYRAGMCAADIAAPWIDVQAGGEHLALQAALALPALANETWRLALTAVIEDTQGELSYWALAHPPGKPDFHHRDGFVVQLNAPVNK